MFPTTNEALDERKKEKRKVIEDAKKVLNSKAQRAPPTAEAPIPLEERKKVHKDDKGNAKQKA